MSWVAEGELLALLIGIGGFIWITMRKAFSDFLIFAVGTILLINIIVWGQNGFRGWAIGGMVVFAAMSIFLNRRRSAQAPQTDHDTGERLVMPETRKAKSVFVRALNMGWSGLWLILWLVMIGIAAGIFGKSPYLHYVFIAIIAMAAATTLITTLIMRFWKMDNSN